MAEKMKKGPSEAGRKTLKCPHKQGINLNMREQKGNPRLTLLVGCLAIVILAGCVAKFGVIDQYRRLDAAQAAYASVHTEYTQMQELLKGYDRLLMEYRTYSMEWATDGSEDNGKLTPGSDLTLKVEVESDSRLVDSVTGKLTTNSLFAEVRNGGTTAVVTYARHLQNLDEGSGLPTAITRALQEQDIQFVNTGMDDGWDSCYPGRRFTPIYNENLTYYDSTVAVGTQSYHPVIYELPVDTDGDGGLFESFRGTLRNIRLCGAEISAGGNAGGLAGSLRGGTTIEGCQVYLSPTRDKLNSKNEQDIWISGATAGGLVGRCGYDLTVRNSFASTVLEGGRCAGGLVGYISGTRTVYVEHSYADCYLYASGTTGGLIGS